MKLYDKGIKVEYLPLGIITLDLLTHQQKTLPHIFPVQLKESFLKVKVKPIQ